MKNFLEFLRQAFCEKGFPSSKRVLAGLIVVVVCFCTIFICCNNPMNEIIRSLLEVEIITACSLLGVSSVTSIWKQGNSSNGYDKPPKKDESNEEE